jgi:hypothetical protein
VDPLVVECRLLDPLVVECRLRWVAECLLVDRWVDHLPVEPLLEPLLLLNFNPQTFGMY